MPVTSKPAQLLQNRHFAEKFFGGGDENVFVNVFQKSACFGVAVQVYTPLSNADRKFIARHIGFSLLRPLAEG